MRLFFFQFRPGHDPISLEEFFTTTSRISHLHPKYEDGPLPAGVPGVTVKPPVPPPPVGPPADDDGQTGWAIAWQAHVYFSGTLFVLLAIYCSVNIARIHSFSR